MSKSVGICVRSSALLQGNQEQIEQCTRHACEKGYSIHRIYELVGSDSMTLFDTKTGEIFNDMDEGDFDTLLVPDRSRISRNSLFVKEVEDTFIRKNKQIIFVNEVNFI